MNPFVSVIIPTYNRKHLLGRAIASVLDQSYTDYELIVVDDGSTDGTGELEIVRTNAGRIIYFRQQPNRGVSAARNEGVRRAAGPWIAFLDSDDEWHRRKLEKQVAYVRGNPDCRIVQTKEIWIRRGARVNPPATHEKKGGDIFARSLDRCMITPSSVMVQKSLLEEAGGFNESLAACEDYDLWLRITCRYPVALIDECLLTRYGGHADQLSATVPVLDRLRVQALADLLAGDLLTPDQRSLAATALVTKARIVAQGSLKRNKPEEYERYSAIAKQFEGCAHVGH